MSRRSRKLRVVGILLALLMMIPVSAYDLRAEGTHEFQGLGFEGFSLDDFEFSGFDNGSDSDAEPAHVDVNATSAGVETSANAGVVPMSSGVTVQVNNDTLLQMFLMGQLGNNNDTFNFTGNLNAPAGAVQGRPGVFTGVITGNATINGLRLAPRTNLATPDAPYRNDIGFVRLLGHGARIEGLTFADPRFYDTTAGGIADWNVAVGNIGLVVGRVSSGSAVTINDVTVRGTTETTNAQFNVGGGTRPYGGKRVGGLVGMVDGGSTLAINNPNVRFAVDSTVTGGTAGTLTGAAARIIPSIGGLIGQTVGNVTIDGGTVYLQTSLTGTVRFQHVGGAIGQSGGVATISNLRSLGIPSTTTGFLTNQLGHGNREAGQPGTTAIGNRSVGGFIGSMNGSAVFRNATNEANIYVTQGRIGGFIGRTQGAGATRIYDSTNLGRIWNSLPAGTGRGRISSSGGFIGQADGSVYIENSVNGRVADTNHASVGAVRVHGRQGAGGFIGISASRGGSSTTLVNVRNYGHIQAYGSRRYVGGFIGHSRNIVHITDTSATNVVLGASVNYGRVRVHNLNNSSGTPNNVGGFIGTATNVVNITNGINRGTIEASGTVSVAGGGRLRLGGFIGLSTNRVVANDVTNYANVWSYARQHTGSDMGGIIGRAEFRGVRANRRVDLNDATNHGNIGWRITATGELEGAAGRTGGLVGFSAHRAAAQGLNITRGLNTGNVLTSVGGGTSGNHNRLMAAGGIVGELNTLNSTINYTMNIGNVTSGTTVAAAATRATVGGIVGRSARNNLTIMNSGNEGVVANGGTASQVHTARQGAGGIIGNIDRGNNTRILRSYNAGSIEGSTVSTGGIIGSVRRRGTLFIEDVYNAGSVMGRHASAGAGIAAQSGNGILGFRRNIGSIYNFRRVMNTGNVHGSPIFDANVARGTNANFNTHARTQNRMVYQGVFWDSSVHTGRPQLMTVFAANNRRHRELVGLQGVPTSVLTSGGLFEFQSPNWVTRGWIESWINNRYEDWETYPWLAWQTPGVTRGEELPEFFGWIRPGADHLFMPGTYPAGTNPVFFNQIYPGSATIAGGHVSDAVRDVRTFIPYGTRAVGQAAGSATILHRAHMPRAAGNFEATVPQAALTQADPAHVGRLSAGLVNPQGVIGFNGNERFEDVVIMGVDGPHYRETPTRTTLITWARISINGTPRGTYGGILGLEDIQVGDRIDITASPGYHPAYRYITQEDVNHFIEHGSLLIRVPMDRAAMHLRVALVNADDEITSGVYEGTLRQIGTGREPEVRRGPEGMTTEALMATTPLPLCPVGNLDHHGPTPVGYPDTPPTSVFSTSHLYPPVGVDHDPNAHAAFWFDEIAGTARMFHGRQIQLWISDIINPNAAGTAADPFYVIMPLEDIELDPFDLFTIREYEDEDGQSIMFALPHGGRGLGNTTPANPSHSVHFYSLEFRNPPLIVSNPVSLPGPGTAAATGGTFGSFNADYDLTGSGQTDAQRNNSAWRVEGATRYTEVRAVPRGGANIPSNGTGGDLRTYRASPWVCLSEILEHHPTTEALLFALLGLDYEYHIQVNVYERVTVLPGVYEYVPLTDPVPSVYHDKDRGIDGLPYYNWDHVRLPEIYRFHPVRVFEGERLIGRAEGFADSVVYASVGVDGEGDPHHNPSPPHVVPIVMERAPSGRLSGFVLPDHIRENPEALITESPNFELEDRNRVAIPHAAVVVITECGQIFDTTSALTPRGFFYFDGLPAGNHTLFATHSAWGRHITVPSPVYIPYVEGSAVGGNANATIFLDDDLTQGFLLLVEVLNIVDDSNISYVASAVLTYGPTPTVRTSYPYPEITGAPFRRINVDGRAPLNWVDGELVVSAEGFRPETLQPVYDDVTRPVTGAQFGLIQVHLSPVHTLEISNSPDPLGAAERRPVPIGQAATATHESPNIADRTFNVAPHFGQGPEGNRTPSTFDDVVSGSVVTLTAGSSAGWTFLGWFTAAQVAAFTPGVAVVDPADLPVSQTHTFTQNANAHWVAVWGNQDGIPHQPNDYMLTINNVPEHPVGATGTDVVRPDGQTASGNRYFGEQVNLVYGIRTDDDLEFLGWWRGENVPQPGQNVNTPAIAGSPNFFDASRNFTMPASATTYTALWGCDEGYIGGRFMLTINNIPIYPVDGPASHPDGQTATGYRSAGMEITLAQGARVDDDLVFLGWWEGANPPEEGVSVATLATSPYFTPAGTAVTFTMPAEAVTFTALWGVYPIIGGNNLVIANLPAKDPLPTNQTPTQTATTTVPLVHGTPVYGDWTFLGWVRNEPLPALGSNIDDFSGTVFPAGHVADPTGGRVTYTAIWGNDEGYVGTPNNNLVVNNLPAFPTRPTGQTPSQVVDPVPAEVPLLQGTPVTGEWTFLGWVRGTNLPAVGSNIDDFAGDVFPAPHTANVPAAGRVIYTAIWGNEEGIVGTPNNNLVVNNLPAFPTRPTGQTPSQVVDPVPADVELEEGTPVTGNWTFLGWVRGDDLPALNSNIDDFAGDVFDAPHTANVPATGRVVYTAIWGNEEGYVGVPNNNLVVNNLPAFPTRPTGQTESQVVDPVPAEVPLLQGTPVTGDWTFLGWVRGETLPAVGSNIDDFAGDVFAAPHTANVPAAGRVIYTAIWGNEEGIVGTPNNNLVVNNLPAFPVRPDGQTPSQVVDPVPAEVPLVAGTPVDGDWVFLGWVRGTTLPAVGSNIDDFAGEVFPVGHAANVPATGRVIYTAIWGDDEGYVGVPNNNLVVNNLPAFPTRPTGQTPTQNVTPVPATVPLEEGTPVTGDWNFLGWVRGTTLPAVGSNIDDFAGEVFPAGHIANVPATGRVIYTAIWGDEEGYVGVPNNNLVVNNLPAFPVRPDGQTPSQVVDPVPAEVPLLQGTPVDGDWVFLGWVRGTTLPAVGSNIDDFAGDVFPAGHIADVPATGRVIYTAIWGDEDGYVGVFRVTVNNVPEYPAGRPDGQSTGGLVAPGTQVTLLPGARQADNLEFLGWWRGTENVPAVGDRVADFAGPNFVPANGNYVFTMPAANVTYTALWGRDGRVGDSDISIVVDVDEEGEVTVTVDPDDIEYDVEVEDGNIIVTFPGNPDSDDITVNLPNDDWDYTICDEGDETVVTIIPPPGDSVVELPCPQDPGDTVMFLYHTVTFNLAGGTYSGSTANVERQVRHGTLVTNVNVPTPTRVGYDFVRWEPLLPERITASATYVAIWTSADITITVDVCEDGEVTVTVDPDIPYEVEVNDDGEIEVIFPSNPDPDDIDVFIPDGWDYDIIERDEDTVVIITPPPGDSVVERPCPQDPGDTVMILYHTVTFDLAGGTYDGSTDNVLRQVRHGSAVQNIPAPTLTGYDFVGWAPVIPDPIRSSSTFVAVWEASAVFTLTFHLYTPNQGIWDAFDAYTTGVRYGRPVIEVPVTPGTAQSTWDGLAEALGLGNIYGVYGTPGHAFWGWFCDDTLNASGRTRVSGATTLRRPALSDRCGVEGILTSIENATTAAAVNALFGSTTGGNIDVFAVWSLWGDVDDDDEVTVHDVERLRRYLSYSDLGLIVHLNLRAADVIVDGDVNVHDQELIRQFVAYNDFGAGIVLGVAPTQQP